MNRRLKSAEPGWRALFALSICLGAAAHSGAQSVEALTDPRPPSETGVDRRAVALQAHVHDDLHWPADARFKLGPLTEEEINRLTVVRDERELEPVGIVRPMVAGRAPLDITAVSAWSVSESQTNIGRFCITSEGAVGLRVHFARFEVPEGTTVTVVGSAEPDQPRTYSRKYPFGKSDFWSHTVYGDCVFIECTLPEDFDFLPVIEIGEIAHVIADELAPANAQNVTAIPYSDTVTLPCHIPAGCSNLTTEMRDSVVRLRFVERGSMFQCSGVVLNDVDENSLIGWLLTASHCISSGESANSVEATWFLQGQQCQSAGGLTSTRTIMGSELITQSPATDFSFMRLTDSLPPGFSLAGWNAGKAGGTVTIVHHPRGTEKSVALGRVVKPRTRCLALPASNFLYVDLDEGITEPGSSGSPAFDSRGRVVGQLYGTCGGELTCADAGKGYDVFGSFALSYRIGQLDEFLNVIRPDDSFEPNDSAAEAAALPFGTQFLQLVDDVDVFAIDVPSLMTLEIQASFEASEVDVDLTLTRNGGPVVDTSEGSGNLELISIEVLPGRYFLRVLRAGGGSGYTLRVSAAGSHPSDIDGDGDVDTEDVLFVLREFNSRCDTAHLPCGDVTGEGIVNTNDLRTVLADVGIRRLDFDDKAWKKFIGKYFKQNFQRNLKSLSKPERREIMNELINLR